MCGECTALAGLHVPEDLVHLDIYDPRMASFVTDGNCGRAVLTTLLPVGAKAGTLLLNYDTEDTTAVISRKPCACGRTHMRIYNPRREAETFWIAGTAINRVDIEASVFSPGNLPFLTGEYEAFLYPGKIRDGAELRVSMECADPESPDRQAVEERFTDKFLHTCPGLLAPYEDKAFSIACHFVREGELEFYHMKGRPKRLSDRRTG